MSAKSGKVITPYSSVQSTSQIACKHFFRCINTDGNFNDSIGNVIWNPASGGRNLSYDSSLKAFSTDMASNDEAIALISGSWNQWGTNSAAMGIVGGRIVDYTIVRFSIGTNAVAVGQGTRSYGMDAAGFFHSVIGSLDGTTYNRLSNDALHTVTITNSVLNHDIVMLNQYLPGSGLTKFQMYDLLDGSLIIEATVNDGTTIGTGISPFQPNAYMRFSGLKVYGAAYYEFTSGTIPNDWLSGILWKGANWKNGNRYLYPGWNGRT